MQKSLSDLADEQTKQQDNTLDQRNLRAMRSSRSP